MFSEALELIISDLGKTIETTSGREGPAGTALSLVLDGGDDTVLGSPVDVTDLDVLFNFNDVLKIGETQHLYARKITDLFKLF